MAIIDCCHLAAVDWVPFVRIDVKACVAIHLDRKGPYMDGTNPPGRSDVGS